jgi:hypothetical protein
MKQHKYFYCRRVSTMGVGQHWSDDRARRAHETGKPYWVLVDSKEKPEIVISTLLSQGNFGVHFLDDDWHNIMIYWFNIISEDFAFLEQAELIKWDNNGDDKGILSRSIFTFQRDGFFEVCDEDRVLGINFFWKGKMEVSANYSRKPTFGNYDDIVARDRINLPIFEPR